MNFNRISNVVSTHYITDPYACLMHYKRAYKLLKTMKAHKASVLCLGNKNQYGMDWKDNFKGLNLTQKVRADEAFISSCSRYYQLIICLDILLYAPYFKNFNVPIMAVCTTKEIHENPEVLDVIDYLLPAPSTKTEQALKVLLLNEMKKNDKDEDAEEEDL